MNSASGKHFDVIVLGVGSMGSSTCFYLAKQGQNVLGLEQFDIPNEHGSHGGQSRIIRKAYFEHPDYVPLMIRAYEKWKDLESLTGSRVYYDTGLLYAGKKDNALVQGVRESATKYRIRVDEVSGAEAKKQFPQFAIPEEYDILFEPDAGFLLPAKCISLFTEEAKKLGADIRINQKVKSWEEEGNKIIVKTENEEFTCSKLVITAGPWVSKIIPELASTLKVTRQVLSWVEPESTENFTLGKFPCWMIVEGDDKGCYYGFPVLPPENFEGPSGLKLAYHFPGMVTDPDNITRNTDCSDESNLISALNKFIPKGYKSTIELKTCIYTNTPDEDFIIDFLPGHENIVVATGFSGHGFKFASVVGEIIADLAIKGNTDLPIGFLNAKRFKII